jgi:hypothetical protein
MKTKRAMRGCDMAWFQLDAADCFNGDETEAEREEWLDEFTRWINARSGSMRVTRASAGLGAPIPAEVIGDLLDYWYENVLNHAEKG